MWDKTKLTKDTKAIPIPIDKVCIDNCQFDMWDKMREQLIRNNELINQAIEFAKKDGFWGKNKKGNIKFHQFDRYFKDKISPLLGLIVATDGAKFINIDYGSTWALTKKELEK